jgi:hypothetical protein
MVHLTHGIRSLVRKQNAIKIMAISIITILMVSSLYIAGSLFFTPSDQQPPTSDNFDTLNIAINQTRNYTHRGVTYEFKYTSGTAGKQLQVSTNGKTPISYAATPGTTYTPFDLIVTIYSVNENQLVTHIIPQ